MWWPNLGTTAVFPPNTADLTDNRPFHKVKEMAVRPIVVWPDPRLREPTRPIAVVTEEVCALYRDLVDTMFAYNGLGIAAIQIGIPLQMFLVEATVAGGLETEDPVAFINPEILWTSDETEKTDEGCLSFPGIYVPIERALHCRVRSTGLDGSVFEVEAEGLFARAIQHENDHLTGKLLVDFVGPLKKQMIRRKLKRSKEEGDGGAQSAAGQ
jgi:peptide deformylase